MLCSCTVSLHCTYATQHIIVLTCNAPRLSTCNPVYLKCLEVDCSFLFRHATRQEMDPWDGCRDSSQHGLCCPVSNILWGCRRNIQACIQLATMFVCHMHITLWSTVSHGSALILSQQASHSHHMLMDLVAVICPCGQCANMMF